MHDPTILAFDIRIHGIGVIEIWHIDPETDGTDDSCGWAYPNLSEYELALADSLIHDKYDNLRRWYEGLSDYDAKCRICQIFRIYKAHARPWWRHPRWHIHHWQIRIVPIFQLKRWLFSRCKFCGKRFAWGYSPCADWGNSGPRWFRSETGVYHHECHMANKV